MLFGVQCARQQKKVGYLGNCTHSCRICRANCKTGQVRTKYAAPSTKFTQNWQRKLPTAMLLALWLPKTTMPSVIFAALPSLLREPAKNLIQEFWTLRVKVWICCVDLTSLLSVLTKIVGLVLACTCSLWRCASYSLSVLTCRMYHTAIQVCGEQVQQDWFIGV